MPLLGMSISETRVWLRLGKRGMLIQRLLDPFSVVCVLCRIHCLFDIVARHPRTAQPSIGISWRDKPVPLAKVLAV